MLQHVALDGVLVLLEILHWVLLLLPGNVQKLVIIVLILLLSCNGAQVKMKIIVAMTFILSTVYYYLVCRSARQRGCSACTRWHRRGRWWGSRPRASRRPRTAAPRAPAGQAAGSSPSRPAHTRYWLSQWRFCLFHPLLHFPFKVTACWKCQISRFQPVPKMIAPCSCAQTTRLLSHTPAGLVLNFLLGGADNQKKAPVRW